MPPDHLQLAALLNDPSTRASALATLLPTEAADPASSVAAAHTRALAAIAPHLSLPALLSVRGLPGLEQHRDVSAVLDAQRDWATSDECPVALRDALLVRVLDGEWEGVWKGMKEVADEIAESVDKGLVLEAEGGRKPVGVVCKGVDEFKEELSKASGGVLDKLDWSNVVLGGGSVLSILTGKQDDATYKGSDLDLFLVGLEPQELVPKVNSIIEQIKAALPPKPKKTKFVYGKDNTRTKVEIASDDEEWIDDHTFDFGQQHKGELLILKGFNAITLVPPMTVKPRRTIQIILHSHKTAFDALASFDLDCCAVGWDGDKVVAVPRACRALTLGANLLDVKLARKGDPTSSTVSSRSLKYLTRGISLALPPVAQSILAESGVDLAAVLKAGREKAASEAERKKVKIEGMSGLGGTLRREWNLRNGGRDRRPLNADYGPANSEWMMLVSEVNLSYSENGDLSHAYWEHATKTMSPKINELVVADKKDMVKGKGSAYGLLTTSYVVPYVASFDNAFILDIAEAKPDPFKLSWSSIRNLQYIVRIPRSALPLIDKAEQKLKEIVLAANADDDAASPEKKVKSTASSAPDFAPDEQEAIQRALAAIKNLAAPVENASSLKGKGKESERITPFIPDSFPGPYVPSDGQTKARSNMSKSVVNPLLDLSGDEIKTKKASNTVWRIAVLAGLWQFRGIDADIDKAMTVVWQAWVATARAATSLPQLFHYQIEDIEYLMISPAEFNALKARYDAQPSAAQVAAKLGRDIARLERFVQAVEDDGAQGRPSKVGEWDHARKRFLLQWVRDEEMVRAGVEESGRTIA